MYSKYWLPLYEFVSSNIAIRWTVKAFLQNTTHSSSHLRVAVSRDIDFQLGVQWVGLVTVLLLKIISPSVPPKFAQICVPLRLARSATARVLLTPLPVREPLTLLLTGLAIGLQLKAEVTSARGRLFATNQTEVWTASAFTRISPTKVSLNLWVYDFQTHQSFHNHSVLWTPLFKMTNLDYACYSYFICIATVKIIEHE